MPPTIGKLVERTIRSRALLRDMRLHIYLPPFYGKHGHPYPVVYLLHPWGADERFWTAGLGFNSAADHLINSGTVLPFLAVMPQGDKSYFINAEDPGGDFSAIVRFDPEHFEGAIEGAGFYGDYILEEVIPGVEDYYDVRAEAESRAIAGISMGGTGAAILAFSHPELFCAVGIHSPMLFSMDRPGPPWIFGFGDEAAFTQRDPAYLASQLPDNHGLRTFLDCGIDDERSEATSDLHYALEAHNIKHTYVSRPGGYDPKYWHANLAEYIGFYAATW